MSYSRLDKKYTAAYAIYAAAYEPILRKVSYAFSMQKLHITLFY